MPDTALDLAGVGKSYAGNPALQGLDLALAAGRVHALVGENGAGKSTAVKIVSGGVAHDAGRMLLGGAPYRPGSPAEAQRAGVVAVQQELSLSPFLPVHQNLWLGHPRARGTAAFDRARALRERSRALCERHGVKLDLDRWVSDLTLEEQQVVEILKALAHAPRVIVFDEPTSALGAARTRWLLGVIERLKAQGCAILFISHRMAEIMAVADDLTVLKDGRKVATVARAAVDEADVVRMMVGRDLREVFPPKADPAHLAAQPPRLVARGLRAEGLRDASLAVRRGEVVGVAGLEGQGQHELLLAIFGLHPLVAGERIVDGQPLAHRSPTRAIRAGLALVPVDRRTEGVVLPLSVGENIALATLDRRQRLGFIDRGAERELVDRTIADLAVRTASSAAPVETLSGGNQQKVALGKWLATAPRVLLLDDPTRGVDIQTRSEIYHRVRRLAAGGMAILLNSTDTIELVGLCDRVLVMYEGAIVGELSGEAITEEAIVGAAVGARRT